MPEVLTPDDSIEKLTGRDLDAAVAERVMRWHEETDYDYKPPQVNWVNERGEFQAIVNRADQLEGLPLWRPSESIEAAMEVVEKMDQEQWCIWIISQVHKGPKWGVSFEAKDRHEGFAADDSLPKAISLAALKAVGAK